MTDAGAALPPAPHERGRVLARFATDPRDQRHLAVVRTVSALLAAAAAGLTLLGRLPVPAFLVAVLGLLISLVWLRQARRAAASARREPEALVVHALGFALDEGERTHFIPWRNVVSVEVDEERLDIVVQQTHGGGLLRIEPRYPGVEIHELVRTLDDARKQAQGAREGAPLSRT